MIVITAPIGFADKIPHSAFAPTPIVVIIPGILLATPVAKLVKCIILDIPPHTFPKAIKRGPTAAAIAATFTIVSFWLSLNPEKACITSRILPTIPLMTGSNMSPISIPAFLISFIAFFICEPDVSSILANASSSAVVLVCISSIASPYICIPCSDVSINTEFNPSTEPNIVANPPIVESFAWASNSISFEDAFTCFLRALYSSVFFLPAFSISASFFVPSSTEAIRFAYSGDAFFNPSRTSSRKPIHPLLWRADTEKSIPSASAASAASLDGFIMLLIAAFKAVMDSLVPRPCAVVAAKDENSSSVVIPRLAAIGVTCPIELASSPKVVLPRFCVISIWFAIESTLLASIP